MTEMETESSRNPNNTIHFLFNDSARINTRKNMTGLMNILAVTLYAFCALSS